MILFITHRLNTSKAATLVATMPASLATTAIALATVPTTTPATAPATLPLMSCPPLLDTLALVWSRPPMAAMATMPALQAMLDMLIIHLGQMVYILTLVNILKSVLKMKSGLYH